MAIKTNTSKTISRASEALGERCEETQKNMERLMERAGCREAKRIKTLLPLIPGSSDDVVFCGLNGVSFYFMRGRNVEMPEPVADILRDVGVM